MSIQKYPNKLYLSIDEISGKNFKEETTFNLLGYLHCLRVEASSSHFLSDRQQKVMNALKKELATRPHLPNSIERKKIRQEKQLEKQNR